MTNKAAKFIKILIFPFLFLCMLNISIYFLKEKGYGLTYQVSDSVPKGLYLILPEKIIKREDRVLFHPDLKWLQLMRTNHWMSDRGDTMMKAVVAIPGDQVCYKNKALWVNQEKIVKIYQFYAPYKTLPQQNFCGQLPENRYLLISTYHKKSFDSRYFGFINRESIIGRAKKVF